MYDHVLLIDEPSVYAVCCREFTACKNKTNTRRWWCLSSTNGPWKPISKYAPERLLNPSQVIKLWCQTRYTHYIKLVLTISSILGLCVCHEKMNFHSRKFQCTSLHALLKVQHNDGKLYVFYPRGFIPGCFCVWSCLQLWVNSQILNHFAQRNNQCQVKSLNFIKLWPASLRKTYFKGYESFSSKTCLLCKSLTTFFSNKHFLVKNLLFQNISIMDYLSKTMLIKSIHYCSVSAFALLFLSSWVCEQ